MGSRSNSTVGHFRQVGRVVAIAGVLLLVSFAARGGGQIVPGTSNPYLAGMPNGSTCCSGDTAPAQSPVLVTGVLLTAGSALTFSVSGSVDNSGFTPTLTPDGGSVFSTTSNNGISGATWPINALVGVFLDASQPDSSAAPSALDFTSTNFTTLSPQLKQAFFIGDGRTGTGSGASQTFIVPSGATRLFIGTSDGFGWFNNSGSFNVAVNAGAGVPTPTPTVPAPTSPVPTLSFPMLALLGLALAGASIFLMRRG